MAAGTDLKQMHKLKVSMYIYSSKLKEMFN